ncbi:MAG: T9SS type A sorting domain-containing protein [Bacteroidales bacterium]|nr:T9SS type A sorting domain-containing protein [Bacteroidales bacterium]
MKLSDRIIIRAIQEGNDTVARAEAVQWVTSITSSVPQANAGPNLVVAQDTPSVSIAGSGTDANGSIEAYLWEKVSGPTVTMSGQNTAILVLTELVPGTYSFRLTVTDNHDEQGSDLVTVTVTAVTGIDYAHSSGAATLYLFPNPASGSVTLLVPQELLGNATVKVYNALGKTVLLANTEQTDKTILNVKYLPKGIYIVCMFNLNAKLYTKLIIE